MLDFLKLVINLLLTCQVTCKNTHNTYNVVNLTNTQKGHRLESFQWSYSVLGQSKRGHFWGAFYKCFAEGIFGAILGMVFKMACWVYENGLV